MHTPLLKQRGFKKHGSFDLSPTYDSAVYRLIGDLEETAADIPVSSL